MKFALVFCAVLGLSLGAVVPHENHHHYVARHHSARNLGDLFKELLDMIPMDKVTEIVVHYVETDPEVQEALAYLKSDDFKKLAMTVEGSQQFKDLAKFLNDSGLDMYNYINIFNDLLGLPHFEPRIHRSIRSHNTRSLMDMIVDILAILPIDEIKQFYHDKIENDPEFQELLRRLRSSEFKELVESIRNMPEFTDLLDRLKKHGIDVDTIMKKINDFFGWGFFSLHHQRSLGDLFDELLAMIPVDKIIEIVMNYIENDPEVQEAVAFLKSDEFKSLVEKIQAMPQYSEYLEYIYNSGIDIYKYINYVHGLLGLPPVHRPGSFRRSTRSLMGMIQDILNVLPLDEMKKFYHEKVENDPDFQALLEKLKSDEFKNIIESIRNMPEYMDMMDRLRAHGIDVDAIRKKINDFFGWGFFSFHHQRSLGDLFDELLAMIPVDKIIEIVMNYIENDPEVQEAVAFLKSDEFKSLVEKIQAMPQYSEYLEYIYNSGIDIYKYINYVHGLLGLPPVHRPGSFRRSTRSLMGMIQDILNVLPLEDMKKFYHEKVENDPDFQALLEKLKSDEFKNIIESIRNMPEYMDMMDRLRAHGIDVDAIRKKINDFFGWGFFSFHHQRSLGDLFDELLAMIPVDKIIEIVMNYIENDPEVQEAVAFLKSDEFKSLVEKIQAMPQYSEYLEYIYNSGIDIYKYINYVHGLLGLPPVHRPGSFRRSTRSLMGMIQDILNVLPLEDMKKFYHEKVENDPDFQALLEKLKSDEFKNIIESIRNMPEYMDMMDRLRAHGIDVDAIRKKINDFFGWGFFSFHHQRSLGDLFDELLAMIPVDKIIEIVMNYIENDPEVQEAVAFLKSDEFKSLVEKIQAMPQYSEYLEYIYNSGIDIYKYINYVHGLLGLPPVHRPGSFRRSTRSLMGMIQDILNVLPLEDMKKFYHEKVENDPDFQALLEKLKSDEFKNIIESIRNMPEYMDMMDRLRAHGIDVDAIRKKINDFFGWGFFSFHHQRSLGDLFDELLAMIPVDKIIEIVMNYIENDPEVQEAVAFLKSDEFKSLVEKIQAMPQYSEYLEYIYNAGIDIYKYINYVHGLLGLPPVHRPGSFRRSTRSLMGMIQDILNVLPLEDMKKFYHEKVENDPDFQALLEKLKSDEFKNIVESIRNMPEYMDMMDRLKSHGVDVDAIRKKINDFFGW